MAIYCLNYGLIRKHFARLADFPISQTYRSTDQLPRGKTVGDLDKNDELIIFSSRKALTFRRSGLKCKVSLLIQEPKEIQRTVYAIISVFGNRFHRILTHSNHVLERCPNAEKWILGGAWVDIICSVENRKTSKVSIIASQKRRIEGHKLRHSIISWARSELVEIDVFGHDYNFLEKKVDGHAPYYFSVVIENSQAAGYFTEKLIDAMLCESIPIYWGDPDIGKYFDTEGMIICNDYESLKLAIANLQVEYFHQRREHISKNRQKALNILTDKRSMQQITG